MQITYRQQGGTDRIHSKIGRSWSGPHMVEKQFHNVNATVMAWWLSDVGMLGVLGQILERFKPT